MPLNDDLDAILKRIEDGQQSEEDLMALRQVLRGDGHQEVLQKLAKYNVHVQELAGHDFQIGDRIYNGWTEQAIDKLLQVIRSEIAELRQVQLSRTDLNADQEVTGFDEIPSCPYQGLSAFQEEHAEFFFGRDRFIDLLLQKVQAKPLVAVVGSSGSGKSSLVFAGLVPRLRQAGDWLIASFRPKNQPFDELAGALVPLLEPDLGKTDQVIQAAKLAESLQTRELSLQQVVSHIQKPASPKLLLIADQFEELYTLSPEGDRISFIDVLLVGVKNISSLKLVLTLRADFCEQAYKHEAFTDALQDADLKLSAMNREDLRLAIECPAKLQEVELEAGLAERTLDNVGQEPGNLPLLEFALTQLWAKQHQRKLTHQAYEEIGGVTKALANHAEAVYTTLTQAEQKQAQQIFLQLVQLNEGTEDTRRIATYAKIGHDCWNLIIRKDGLADQRLVVTGHNEKSKEEIIEIIHEALIKEWQRLNQWLNENRDKLRKKQKIEMVADDWKDSGMSKEHLLYGKQLRDVRAFQNQQNIKFSSLTEEFIQKSINRSKKLKIYTWSTYLVAICTLSVGGLFYVRRELQISRLWLDVYVARENVNSKTRNTALQDLVSADVKLDGIHLKGSNLDKINLSEASLVLANLSNTSLKEAKLNSSLLAGVDFRNSDLRNANLLNAAFFGADIENADLRNTVGLTPEQLKYAQNWEKAIYDKQFCERLKKESGLKECRTKK